MKLLFSGMSPHPTVYGHWPESTSLPARSNKSPFSQLIENVSSEPRYTHLAARTGVASTSEVLTWTTTQTVSGTPLVCTWKRHCVGDPCKVDNDCDQDFVCLQGQCSAYQSVPDSHHGLDAGAAAGIGVAVPATLAVIAGIAYLVWRARRRRRKEAEADANRIGLDKPELDASSSAKRDPQKPSELPGDNRQAPVEVEGDGIEPAELETIEPVELEGDLGESFAAKVVAHSTEPVRSPRSPHTRWVEITPDEATLVAWTASPTSYGSVRGGATDVSSHRSQQSQTELLRNTSLEAPVSPPNPRHSGEIRSSPVSALSSPQIRPGKLPPLHHRAASPSLPGNDHERPNSTGVSGEAYALFSWPPLGLDKPRG